MVLDQMNNHLYYMKKKSNNALISNSWYTAGVPLSNKVLWVRRTSHYNLAGSKLRSSHRRCSIKKAVLKISKYSQESTCAGIFF